MNTLEDAQPGELSFLSNERYRKALASTRASAVVLKDGVDLPEGRSAVRCEDPYAAITISIIVLHGYRRHPQWGRSEGASIHESAKIGANPNIAAGVTIAANVTIGDNSTVYPGCYIADGARIGNDCILFPNVVIYDGAELGDRVTIHAGSVVGEDGLGYAPHEGRWVKIPQVGRVILQDDVEIGANCSIDRATLGQTVIAEGTKFSNNVVIGHGAKIGRHCMLVAQVGIAGSVTVNDRVTMGGQVGVAGHLEIGEGVEIAAQSGIASNVPPGTRLLGSPAFDIRKAKRAALLHQQLPEWVQRIRELERQVAQLSEQLAVSQQDAK